MLIAISQQGSVNKYGEKIDLLENNYINYLEKFGIELLIIPNTIKKISNYLEKFSISGIILSGGNNINPELYEGENKKELSISKERDETEKKLLEVAVDKKLPVFGICRGMQFINVFFKGKLVKIENHSSVEHSIKTADKEVKVNSYHNYGVKENILSHELKKFAQSSDGVIEGIFHPLLPIAGIQWHPERDTNNEFNKKIINAFLKRKLFWEK